MVLQAFSGDTIARLANRLINKEATIDNFNYVIFQVGTNDIAKKASFQSIISYFLQLFQGRWIMK